MRRTENTLVFLAPTSTCGYSTENVSVNVLASSGLTLECERPSSLSRLLATIIEQIGLNGILLPVQMLTYETDNECALFVTALFAKGIEALRLVLGK